MLKNPRNLITIVGNTGVGKSQLSIEIAKALNGEIINGDSMQVYKGLDNITNKHPIPERENIPHHLLGHVSWKDEYSVKQFEDETVKLVDDITSRGKVPILVGGTHYYIQSILFKNSTVSGVVPVHTESTLTENQQKILNSDPEIVFANLMKYDPSIASKFHPNDTRRVRRALEIFYTTNKKASDIYNSQTSDNSEQSIKLRYRSLVFWVWCEKTILNQRLDRRVDQMISNGLYDELHQMYREYQRLGSNVDLERGIWQVIGFKQFLPWLKGEQEDPNQCKDVMQQATRKYASKQTKWIQKKLLSMMETTKNKDPELVGDVALLDSSDLSSWNEQVAQRGIQIARDFVKSKTNPVSYSIPLASIGKESLLIPRDSEDSFSADKWKHFICDICLDKQNRKVICVGETAWNIHKNSRKHRHAMARRNRQLVNGLMSHEKEKSPIVAES